MDRKTLIKDQFNRQALPFSKWTVTKNKEYLKRYVEFLDLSTDEKLLDVACGSGEFAFFCAPRIHSAHGVDISDKQIEMARERILLDNPGNVTFHCHDVERIPLESGAYSLVLCKSAFHHFDRAGVVFGEMARLTRKGGKISIQDIVAYENPEVNAFFEALEKSIDRSHYRTLRKDEILSLFEEMSLEIIKEVEVQIELNVKEYLNHAFQSPQNRAKIGSLLDQGLNDGKIAPFFINENNVLFFKRNVFLALGRKPEL